MKLGKHSHNNRTIKDEKMGYNLTIGEMNIEYNNDDDCPQVRPRAMGEGHEGAPSFGEPTDCTNSRWPSYGSWSDSMTFIGLEGMFYDTKNRDDSILQDHPGCIPLTQKHRKEVNAAMVEYKIKYPNAIPTYGNPKGWDEDPDNPDENSYMTRLVWLHYWINWAMDNCKQPVFENS